MIENNENVIVSIYCGAKLVGAITLKEAFEVKCGDTFREEYVVTSEIYYGNRVWVYHGFERDRLSIQVEKISKLLGNDQINHN